MIKNDTDDIPDDELLDALEEIKEKVNASEPFLRHVISLVSTNLNTSYVTSVRSQQQIVYQQSRSVLITQSI